MAWPFSLYPFDDGEDMTPTSTDTRYCYSATCTWHGSIYEVVKGYEGLPGCPHCGSVLYEYKSREEWKEQAKKFAEQFKEDSLRHIYPLWLESLRRGHCIPLKNWDWRKSLMEFMKNEPQR